MYCTYPSPTAHCAAHLSILQYIVPPSFPHVRVVITDILRNCSQRRLTYCRSEGLKKGLQTFPLINVDIIETHLKGVFYLFL